MNKALVLSVIISFYISLLTVSDGLAKTKPQTTRPKEAQNSVTTPAVKQTPVVEEARPVVSPEEALAAKAKEEAAAAEIAAKKAKQRLELSEKAQVVLDAHEWPIYVTSFADKKAPPKPDTLIFSKGKVSSKELGVEGFKQSNCTINVQEDETIIWETMQANENGDIVFLRGELKDKVMQGAMNKQVKGQVPLDFAFTTVAPKVVEEKVESPKTEPKKEQVKEQPKPKEGKKGDKGKGKK